MASLLSSFQIQLETPSWSQTSLPPQSLLKWRNLSNYNRCCPSPFMYPVWTPLSSFWEYIAFPLPPGAFVCSPQFNDKWGGRDLLKHIILHHPQMFESLQMLELQYVPNKYSLNSELFTLWFIPMSQNKSVLLLTRKKFLLLLLLAATIFFYLYSFCLVLWFCEGWTSSCFWKNLCYCSVKLTHCFKWDLNLGTREQGLLGEDV